LVLQTILPALLVAEGPSTVTIKGGTHNAWAPPFEFLSKAYLPLINRMGPRVSAHLMRHGFYPAGGGRFEVRIQPSGTLQGTDLLDRGRVLSQSAVALVAQLPRKIGRREVRAIRDYAEGRNMPWPKNAGRVEMIENSRGPGNAVLVEIASKHLTEVFCGFGRRGLPAEKVAEDAISQALDYLEADVPVGPHLADQWILPLAIAAWQSGRGGSFRTLPLTQHATTHVEIIRRFLEVPIRVETQGATSLIAVGAA
jgi:RNA 3'-terminal phosphate cyclase (ATP)